MASFQQINKRDRYLIIKWKIYFCLTRKKKKTPSDSRGLFTRIFWLEISPLEIRVLKIFEWKSPFYNNDFISGSEKKGE